MIRNKSNIFSVDQGINRKKNGKLTSIDAVFRMTYGHALAKNPCPMGDEFLQFWKTLPWSSYLYTYFVCSMPGR